MSESRRLYRSRTDKKIAGICGGLGKYFGIDPVIFRIIWLLLLLGMGAGLVVYLILWLVIPLEPQSTAATTS
jgi:phage shock protein PspC (stress-responsive transcriptional regulator)